jgi:uncharacterized protein
MKLGEAIKKLTKDVKARFAGDSSGHDITHCERVMRLGLKIQTKEGGNRLVIAVAGYLHDIHRMIQNETGKYCSPVDSLDEVKKILYPVIESEDDRAKILDCIAHHEEYKFAGDDTKKLSLEAQILQDADNLDAIGAIGVVRAFMYAGAHGVPLWLPDVSFTQEKFTESKTCCSAIHHFYRKLMKLAENMNTPTGRKLAVRRQGMMTEFLEEFKREWAEK